MKKQIEFIIEKLLAQRSSFVSNIINSNTSKEQTEVAYTHIEIIDELIKYYVNELRLHNDKKTARSISTGGTESVPFERRG